MLKITTEHEYLCLFKEYKKKEKELELLADVLIKWEKTRCESENKEELNTQFKKSYCFAFRNKKFLKN